MLLCFFIIAKKASCLESFNCRELINKHFCRHHLALPSEADAHFRAVCRALVTEAVELSSFMEKVSSTASSVETDSELGQLDIQDWVSFHDTSSEGDRFGNTEFFENIAFTR